SICARIALLLVFLRQLLETGFFRHIYQMDNAQLARLLPPWIASFAVAAVVMAVAGRYTAELMVIGTDIPADRVKALFPSVVVQTTLWTLNSGLEMFIVRELLSR